MLRILVADDVELIRDGIRAMLEQIASIDTPSEPLDIVTVSSGTEAIREMEREPADLLITDISMPDLNGIDLMEQCHLLWPKTFVIVISGYDEFKYAQKAIEYSARAYLLKPINQTELFRAVRQADTEKQQRLCSNLTQSNAERSINTLFLHYLRGEGDNAELKFEIMDRYPFLSGTCTLVLVGFPGRSELGKERCAHFREDLASRLPERSLLLEEGAELVLIMPDNIDIAAMIGRIMGGTAAVAIGGNGVVALRSTYEQAKNIFVHRLLFPDKKILYITDINQLLTDFTIPYGEVERFVGMIGVSGEAELRHALMQLFERRRLTVYGIGYTLALCDTLYRRLRKLDHRLSSGAKLDPIHKPLEFESMREYLLYASDQVLCMHHAVTCSYLERGNITMEKAEMYIKENYMKPITLTIVSNEVSLNYAYFSSAFKKHTGKTFSEYLRDIRLDEAKRLLCEDITISKVAQRVGYDSYKSFYRAFREAVGITPAEYRKRRLGTYT